MGPVLVGANLSEHGDEAIRQADAWARMHGGDLVVCHVTPSDHERLEPLLRQHAARLTGRSEDDLRTLVLRGEPDAQLVRQAEELHASLVVVGSHSHSGLRRIFLGDVSESVVAHARCSVLVARPRHGSRRILVATDFADERVVALAAEHARLAREHLTVACSIQRQMHQAREMTSFGAAYNFLQHEYDDACRTAEARLAELMTAAGAQGTTRIIDGEPAPALIKVADEEDADLIVIGADAFGPRHIVRSVAENVARAAPCPVVVVRNHS